MADNATNLFETALLGLIFNQTSIAGIAQTASAAVTYLSITLHTASPGEGGDATSSEANYTGYVRVGVGRDASSGWTITGTSTVTATVSPNTFITFPQCSAGSNTITHFGIGGSTVAGTTTLYIYGTVTPNISVSAGVTPRLTTSTAITIT